MYLYTIFSELSTLTNLVIYAGMSQYFIGDPVVLFNTYERGLFENFHYSL